MERVRRAGRWAVTGLTAALLGGGAGCGREFGAEVAVRPDPVVFRRVAERVIRIPDDVPFALRAAPASQAPAPDGEARAEADARPDGTARAVVEVRNGGQAQAEFQLGHAVRNDTDVQTDVEVTLRVRFGYELDRSGGPPRPDSELGLRLYAQDERSRMLRSFVLLSHSGEAGPVASTDERTLRFRVTLGPRQTLTVYLAGLAQAEMEPGQQVRAAVEVQRAALELRLVPAPGLEGSADDRR